MATNTIKKVNIDDLPVNTDVSNTDYFLVQGPDQTFRVKFGNIIIGKENTTFGQEINELYSRVGTLEKSLEATDKKVLDTTTIDTKINETTSQIGALDSKLTAKIDNVSTNVLKVTQLDKKVTNLSAQVASYTSKTASKTDLSQLQSNVTHLEGILAVLEERVRDIEIKS
jgi:hypothetical protein